jgi:hypothetical protein
MSDCKIVEKPRMIYRMMKQLSGILIGIVITLAVIWFVPVANAFPASAFLAAPSVAPILETVATTPALHYQGRLLDPVNGQPKADGAYTFTFRIYNTATGGAPLWTETKSVSVNKGLFSTLLGDTTPLDATIFTGQDLYLGVTIGTDPEAAPRQRLAHVAYALYAEKAGNANLLNGQGAAAFAPATHAHSGEQINAGTVADARIDSAITRDSEVMPLVLARDGAGSTLDADTLDGLNAGAFAGAGHNHDGRYYIRQFDTQFTRTLAPGQSETIYTHSWPEAWYVQWSLRPNTIGGKIQWNGWIERGANGLFSYWFQVTNNGTITTDYAASYAVLQ